MIIIQHQQDVLLAGTDVIEQQRQHHRCRRRSGRVEEGGGRLPNARDRPLQRRRDIGQRANRVVVRRVKGEPRHAQRFTRLA